MENGLLTEGFMEGAELDMDEQGNLIEPTGDEPEKPDQPEPVTSEQGAPEATGTQEGEQQPENVDEEPEITATQMRAQMEKMRSQINSLHRRLKKTGKAQPAIKAPEPLDKSTAPKMSDFETIEEYEKAQNNWEIDQRVVEGIRKATQPVNSEAQLKEERAEFVNDTVSLGKTIYNDFDKVVLQDNVPITMEMIDTVRTMDDNEKVTPADLLYYLGKNPAEATACSRMSGAQLIRALAKIETKLEGIKSQATPKPTKTISDAPPPIKPTDSTVIVHKDPTKMTQAEYEAWRMGG
jgi:hypothetical protein